MTFVVMQYGCLKIKRIFILKLTPLLFQIVSLLVIQRIKTKTKLN